MREPHKNKKMTNLSSRVALFSAVECNQIERAKTILDDGKVNVNR